ncbi:hypothetical protein [Nisaea sp.]|uniref:hypothetical protein n=1 Tax=Nisaea sp. TaxID=2024842 RepID=UPI0032646F89
MSDTTHLHVGENTQEHIAFKLLEVVASVEQKNLFHYEGAPEKTPTREWVLNTFAECLQAARSHRKWKKD